MTNKPEIIQSLKNFDLNSKEIKIYLCLLQKNRLTPLEISRQTNINRSSVYRNLEKLQKLGLIQQIIGHKTTSFQASPPENLKLLVTKKEVQLSELQQNLNPLISQLTILTQNIISPTQIFYFTGIDGIRQLIWNTTKSKTEVLGYGYLDWNKAIGQKYAEKIRQEYVNNNIPAKEITNGPTQNFTENKKFLSIYQEKFISKNKILINHDTYIYDNIFAFSNIYHNEFFGVEIHNTEITQTQRQIFNVLWNLAQKP